MTQDDAEHIKGAKRVIRELLEGPQLLAHYPGGGVVDAVELHRMTRRALRQHLEWLEKQEQV